MTDNGTPLTLAQPETIDRIGVDVAAITHGHPLGYIRSLGEGWVGDEAFAIALYCSLRHRDSFEDALADLNGDILYAVWG